MLDLQIPLLQTPRTAAAIITPPTPTTTTTTKMKVSPLFSSPPPKVLLLPSYTEKEQPPPMRQKVRLMKTTLELVMCLIVMWMIMFTGIICEDYKKTKILQVAPLLTTNIGGVMVCVWLWRLWKLW
jgi:hypothetical protein